MPDIHHSKFQEYLQKSGAAGGGAVYLVHGEAMLVEQCVEPLIETLLQGASREINCDVVEGAAENIPDLLERLNTYSLSADPRIVWFKDARLFDGGHQQRQIDQIREALENEQPERAAKGFLNMCMRLGVDPLSAGQGVPTELDALKSAVGEGGIQALSSYCREHGLVSAASQDYLPALEQAVRKGFPDGHHLIVTASTKIPKNRKLYKIIDDKGLIVDCSVPQGDRRADKIAQETVLRQILEAALSRAGKRMAPSSVSALIQLTGFDPATLRDNIEKLIDYSGSRREITNADVDAVVRRTKSDPLFELTNAVAERHPVNALFYLHTLLESGWHALQILAALANQVRKLIVAKDFTRSVHGRHCWRPGMAYPQFQSEVLPAVQAFDADVGQQIQQWSDTRTEAKTAGGAGKGGIDPRLAPNPGSAYPVYQTVSKSENYTCAELEQAMIALNRADVRLKTSGSDPELLMKKLVMDICRKR